MDNDESNHLRKKRTKHCSRKCGVKRDRLDSPDVHAGSLDEGLRPDELRNRFGTGRAWTVGQVTVEVTETRRRVVETVSEAVGVVTQRAGRWADWRVTLRIVGRRRRRSLWNGSARERTLQAVVAAMKTVGLRDECVGVGRWRQVLSAVLVVAVLLDQQLLLRLIGVVFLQMLRQERLAQRQLFRVANAQIFAQRHDGLECLHRVVDAAIDIAKIWDLRREEKFYCKLSGDEIIEFQSLN